VLTHPRCMNCHPAGEHPLQGADHHEHRPVVWRNDTGNLGTPCGECHTEQNVTLREHASYQSIPGHPRWGVAPLEMAWQGKSLGEICRQLKDTARQRRPRPRAAAGAHRQGRPGRLGLDPRRRPRPRARHAGGGGAAGASLDRFGRGVSGVAIVSRTRCSAQHFAKRCTAEPGPHHTPSWPGLTGDSSIPKSC
jgi:hypothetical protein